MLKALLLITLLGQVADSKTYEIEIKFSGPITVTVTEKTATPDPDPDPDPDPLPLLIEVGPGKPFEELHQIDPRAIPANATVRIHYREAPYRSKLAILKPMTIEGVPGPNNEKPSISGENAKTHPASPLAENIQGVSVLCVSKIKETEKVTIKNLILRDAWEQDKFTRASGVETNYGGGTALVRVTAGNVTIENCTMTEGIHGVFSKCTEGHGVTLTLKNCEIVSCGNATGTADEAAYTESRLTTLDHVTIHQSRNPTTQGIHSRDAELKVLNGSYLESNGITILSNSCEADSPLMAGGKIPSGVLEIRDSVIYSTSASRSVELKTDWAWEQTKSHLIVHDSLFVKQTVSPEWKSFWITLRHASQKAEFHDTTFVSCSADPKIPPTSCYFSTGVGETIEFGGKNQYIAQTPLPKTIYMLWTGTANIMPETWQDTFAVTTGLDQPAAMKRVAELIEEKTKQN